MAHGILLLAAAFLAGLLLVPGRLLAVQEQRLYGRKTAQDVLSPQFAADTGDLIPAVKYAGSVPPGYISESSGNSFW